ncbi:MULTISPECIES: hypothetical protein [Kitasatospora]|uniref:Secreted protein n=1 Tax=Kitasatospora setae (strain ATCC 33774 / DSM 43861 / JCM 3304 / KCC A-0304 / NBRC 14216 / KM-6054) TaxID=452652 RepID=E4NBT3_KITSK|nr:MULTISPECIES: hypothetical protein [Kitasatospora]BAJ28664.1 hypothetical protein KSE_28530 [Kitasatospora setae KM-6054]
MRSGLVQLGAWTAATGAAVALSWLGVHAVLVDTVFEQPVAIQLPSVTATKQAGTGTPAPPTTDPPPSAAAPSPDPTPPAGTGTVTGSGTGSGTNGGTGSGAGTPATGTPTRKNVVSTPPSTVHSYPVLGGRVALDQRPTEARLVSAVPEAGWSMQVWHGDQWLRVDFSKGDRVSSVIVSWNGHEPDVQTAIIGN